MVASGVMVSWNVSFELHSMKSGMGAPHVLSWPLASSIKMSSAFWFFCTKPKSSTNSLQICSDDLSCVRYLSFIVFWYDGASTSATCTSRSLVSWIDPTSWLSCRRKFSRPASVIMKLCSSTMAIPWRMK